MRLVVACLACAACIRTSVDTDGRWSSLTQPCVPIGDTHRLLEARYSVTFVPAGNTLLYSPGESISQLNLETGDDTIVLRSDGVSLFGSVGENLVYYESNGDPLERIPIDVIVDRGARSTSRYERISPHPGQFSAGLMTVPSGVYWWTTVDGGSVIAEWRWDPETGAVEPFVMERDTFVRWDDTSFFYANSENQLIVRPQIGGEPRVAVEIDKALAVPQPIGIDGESLFYTRREMKSVISEVIARDPDGTERVLATGQVNSGAVDPTYVWFTDDDDSPEQVPRNIYRVPRTGGPVETMFTGGENTGVFDLRIDRCNVYWQQVTLDKAGGIYGREITP